MDHTHSELPVGDPTFYAGLLIHKLGLAINHNPQLAASVLVQNAQLREPLERFLELVLDTAEQPPRDEIHTAVDNSILDLTEIDPIIHNDVLDPNIDETDCSADTVVSPPSQAALPRRPVLSMIVPPTPMNGHNKSALVIEHDHSLSRMFKKLLECEHYVVRTARDGEDAVHLYRDCAPFEVVLIEYGMPRKHGIDVALDILKQDPTQPMIIIASDYRSEAEVPRPKELMHVPLLVDMSNSRLRRLLESLQPWATREEVDSAVAALTAAELLRLKQFGEGRACFSQGTDYRTGEDLLQEALRLTFEGNRRWNKRVSFETYLTGVIKSISRRRKGDRITDGQEFCVLDNFAGNNRAADEHLIAKEQVAEVFAEFKDDIGATQVIHGWFDGLKKNGIMQKYGLSENRYRAAVKRIRLKLLRPTNGRGGSEKHDGQD
jgi:CheY-like chemotaxis protein